MTFKPMLAGKYDPAKNLGTWLGSPKLDGIRASVKNGKLLSRSLKLIPNHHARNEFDSLEGFDGELILGDPTADDVFRRTTSAVMGHEGKPDLTYWVFDIHDMEDSPYEDRLDKLLSIKMPSNVVVVPHTKLVDQGALEAFEEIHVELGYEGVMLNDPRGLYKNGRATTNGGELLKVKRFEDSEAYLIDIIEEQENTNEAQTNELGRTKRSSAQAGKIGKGRMGALLVRDIVSGVEFNIGTGFSAAERAWFWMHRKYLLALNPRVIVKYKFFPVGVKDLPRHPVYCGLRSEIDL